MKTITVTIEVREDVCWKDWNYNKGCKPKDWPEPCPFMAVGEYGGTGDAGWRECWCLVFKTKLKGGQNGVERCEACKQSELESRR